MTGYTGIKNKIGSIKNKRRIVISVAKVTRIGFTNTSHYKNIQGKAILARDIFSIDYDQLHALGVERLVFDFDGTLAPRQATHASEEVFALLKKLSTQFDIAVYSNNFFHWRTRQKLFLSRRIEYRRTQKPFVFERDGRARTVIIGDKWLTDRLYAWARKWGCVLVEKPA